MSKDKIIEDVLIKYKATLMSLCGASTMVNLTGIIDIITVGYTIYAGIHLTISCLILHGITQCSIVREHGCAPSSICIRVIIYLLIFIDNSPKSLNCSYRNHLTAVLYAWYRRFYGCQALPNHFQAIIH